MPGHLRHPRQLFTCHRNVLPHRLGHIGTMIDQVQQIADRIQRVVNLVGECRGQPSCRRQPFTVAHGLLSSSLFADVVENQHDTRNLALFVSNRRTAVFDGEFRSVAADQSRVICQPHDLSHPDYLGNRTLRLDPRHLVDDVEDLVQITSLGFRERPSGQLLRNFVHEE